MAVGSVSKLVRMDARRESNAQGYVCIVLVNAALWRRMPRAMRIARREGCKVSWEARVPKSVYAKRLGDRC